MRPRRRGFFLCVCGYIIQDDRDDEARDDGDGRGDAGLGGGGGTAERR